MDTKIQTRHGEITMSQNTSVDRAKEIWREAIEPVFEDYNKRLTDDFKRHEKRIQQGNREYDDARKKLD